MMLHGHAQRSASGRSFVMKKEFMTPPRRIHRRLFRHCRRCLFLCAG
jgi:hypothetical protein